jgi:hypothetical protein
MPPKKRKQWTGKFDRQFKKVAILGFTPHKDQAPINDPEWEIWGLNDLYVDLDKHRHATLMVAPSTPATRTTFRG